MQRLLSIALVGSGLWIAVNASAQEPGAEPAKPESGTVAPPARAAAGVAAPLSNSSTVIGNAPVETAASPLASTPLQAGSVPASTAFPVGAAGVACVTGEHPPEYPDSARTATRLVCEALRNRGVLLAPAPRATAAYVVSLDQLGSAFFLRVDYESPIGTVQTTRRASLYDLSEAEFVAPRLAKAIVTGESVPATQSFDNVAGSESRRYQKKRGEFVIGGGIAGISAPESATLMAPALHLFAFYETTRWGIGLQLHFRDAAGSSQQPVGFTALSVGGRYYFGDGEVSPVIGAGLAITELDEYERTATGTTHLSGSGSSAFVEAGVEVFRLHSTRFIATLRADAPFYSLRSGDGYDSGYCSNSICTTAAAAESTGRRYEFPISCPGTSVSAS